MNKLSITLGSLLLLGVAFLMVDCCAGKTRFFECAVSGHHYVAPWVETTVSTDSDGHVTVGTTYHPEEFYILCSESQGDLQFTCCANRGDYYVITNGQDVTVKTRQGRWTKGHYLPHIEP